MYKIRTCKICNQKLHIKQKGRLFQIKNRCKHFEDKLITLNTLDIKTIPIEQFRDVPITNRTLPKYCIVHKTKLQFARMIKHNVELYYCPTCANIDKTMSKSSIKRWKKQTWSKDWNVGDVKIIGRGD